MWILVKGLDSVSRATVKAPWGWSHVHVTVSNRLGYLTRTGCTGLPDRKAPVLKGNRAENIDVCLIESWTTYKAMFFKCCIFYRLFYRGKQFEHQGVAVVWWSTHRITAREVRGSNPAAASLLREWSRKKTKSIAREQSEWMDGCARAKRARAQTTDEINYAGVMMT